MILDKPYFMQKESWYRYDPKKQMFELTEQAPVEAKASYRLYYEQVRKQYGNVD